MSDNFRSIKGGGAIWEPKQIGSQKGGDLKARKPSAKDYLIGYFIGSEHNVGQKGNSTVHKIQMKDVGEPKCFSEPVEEGAEVSIWGSHVLNDMMSKVAPGTYIKVQWLGKKSPKQAGGNEFHDWDVLVDDSVAPLQIGGTFTPPPAAEQTAAAPEAATEPAAEEEDDLPF